MGFDRTLKKTFQSHLNTTSWRSNNTICENSYKKTIRSRQQPTVEALTSCSQSVFTKMSSTFTDKKYIFPHIPPKLTGSVMMMETRVAKLFKNGASQAVRLPMEFRFEGNEVYVTRDDVTGDVVLSNRPGAKTWNAFFELLHEINVPADFMAERPMNVLPQESGVFDDELPHGKASR